MCWRGYSGSKVAKRDIEVYKAMFKDGKYYVPYFYSSSIAYEVGKLYKQNMDVQSGGYLYRVEAGFHSYSMEVTYVKRDRATNMYGVWSKVDKYFRGYYYDKLLNNVHFVKCIIPKGAEYFENEDGEIVSNMIIVTGEEMDKDMFVGF